VILVGAALGALLAAALAGCAYWLGWQRGRRATWQAGERIITRLLDELELMESAEREWLSEHTLSQADRDDLRRMH
jgi:hypothetical protein